jgi:PhzF family phenazine biosynthesis protein
MHLRYRLLNVFTRDSEALSGNALCVFEDAGGLADAHMQALARQFNLSESTFLARSERASARLRMFTPDYELPFAGHPILGSAHVVRALGAGDRVTLDVPAGIIPVQAEGNAWTLTANPAVTREIAAQRHELAAALGLAVDALAERPLWVDCGTEQLIVPLRDAASVTAARPVPSLRGALRNRSGVAMALVFAPTGDATADARFFFENGAALSEDPATGSACANLGGWHLAMGSAVPMACEVRQGDAVKRPSTLRLSIDAQRRVAVAGEVIEIGSGVIELPD